MEEKKESNNYLEEIVAADIASGSKRVHTRFPPEPNGYLHIGHCKAIWISFSIAERFGGKTNLRFDDTNPVTEDTEYVNAIQEDIKWLGFKWEGDPLYTSDYFDKLYEFAVILIRNGKAYVDDSSPEQIAEMKGSPTNPGTDSPFKQRTVEENLGLFEEMKNGNFEDGSKVLRANIDMAAPNMLMRDPIIFRIKNANHHRTGDKWNIYPMYDFAHGQSDSIEEITHSLCSLEFMHHRPLYDWFIEQLGIFPSKQYEFARMNVEFMITSKRKLLQLVEKGLVCGWDDPRMPTISGMRRRGFPAPSLTMFCEKTGVTKRDNLQEISLLHNCVRDVLNKTANRAMAVLDPVKLVITNYPEGQVDMMKAENNPEDEAAGAREMPFSRNLLIERDDFKEEANKKYYRLSIGKNVRLKNAYIIHGESCEKDENGNITQINCTYYPDSKSGEDTSGVKAKGTLHWVSAEQATEVEVRDYEHLFTVPNPTGEEGTDFLEFYNEESLVVTSAFVEPSLLQVEEGQQFQFMRKGYYCVDKESEKGKPIFNRTLTLKDSWAKSQNKN